jgi:hypothetical protein
MRCFSVRAITTVRPVINPILGQLLQHPDSVGQAVTEPDLAMELGVLAAIGGPRRREHVRE